MSNFSAVLKAEISRLAAKEVRAGTPALKRSSAKFRREIATLKRSIKQCTKQVGFLIKQNTDRPVVQNTVVQPVRFSPKWLKSHRVKFDLSARDYAKLLGVSALTVYGWEKGKSKPRAKNLPALAAIRVLRKKDARIKLDLLCSDRKHNIN